MGKGLRAGVVVVVLVGAALLAPRASRSGAAGQEQEPRTSNTEVCLLYTSDAADE